MMRLWVSATVVACLIAGTLGRKPWGYKQFHIKGRNSGDRDDSCQRMPFPMPLTTLRNEIEGKGYTRILGFSSGGANVDRLYHHSNYLFNETDTQEDFEITTTQRHPDDTSPGPCRVSRNILTNLSPGRANFQPDFATITVTYSSRNPRNYLLESVCRNITSNNLRTRCCEGSLFVAIYSRRTPPHFLDWKAMRREIWEKLGLRLSEFYSTQNGLVCPNAAP